MPVQSKEVMTKNERQASVDRDVFDNNEQNVDWQNQMLERLIKSAVPEPIKVACTVSPPGKPNFLGEEYHGRITKEEEKKLLGKKSGRYIVRESFSATRLHKYEYTVAFNYDGDTQHIKLLYNPARRRFKTEDSIKDFNTILELMTDVLSLYQDVKRRQSTISSVKKEKYCKPHNFKSHNYKHPKWCDECGQFLWGLYSQGYKCEDCGINVHKACKEQVPLPCSTVVVGRKISYDKKPAEEKISKKRRSKHGINNASNASPSSSYLDYLVIHNSHRTQCLYFRQCSRFLSAFNIRDSFIDMNNNLTRCFCDKCIGQKEANIVCSSLNQWARFEFERKEDTLKRNVKNWEVVYFAIKPLYIVNVIQKCFNPPELGEDFDLVVAPSLAYTTQDMKMENWSYKFTDTHTNGDLFAQTVLEVYLKPDSYEILAMPEDKPQTHECGAEIRPEHWKVKRQAHVYPKSILVKIFD